MITRRPLMLGALAAPLAVHDARAEAARTLRVIPQANLTSLDPIWTTAVVTRNHGFMVSGTSSGPMTPAKTPPAMTADRARAHRAGGAQSAAAKRKDSTTAA